MKKTHAEKYSAFIKANSANMTAGEMAEELGCKIGTIYGICREQNIVMYKKDFGHRNGGPEPAKPVDPESDARARARAIASKAWV